MPVTRNRRGVSLVEVMIALVILLFVFMGLLQASLLSIDANASNVLRDEAVRLANDTISAVRISPLRPTIDLNRDGTADVAQAAPVAPAFRTTPSFTISSTGSAAEQLNGKRLGINTRKTVRNILNANFIADVYINQLDADNLAVTVIILWDYKDRTLAGGNPNWHRAVVLLRRT